MYILLSICYEMGDNQNIQIILLVSIPVRPGMPADIYKIQIHKKKRQK